MAGPFEFVLTRSVCRGVRAACAPRRACGPANASLGSPAHAQIRGLTRQLAGLRAYQGADVHVQGFACDQHTAPGTVVPKTQTTSAATPPFSMFFTEVVCDLGTLLPRTVTSPPPNGGICIIRGATRRRHAVSQLLMLQNPHRRNGGHRRNLRAGLWGARAAAPVGGTDTTAR